MSKLALRTTCGVRTAARDHRSHAVGERLPILSCDKSDFCGVTARKDRDGTGQPPCVPLDGVDSIEWEVFAGVARNPVEQEEYAGLGEHEQPSSPAVLPDAHQVDVFTRPEIRFEVSKFTAGTQRKRQPIACPCNISPKLICHTSTVVLHV